MFLLSLPTVPPSFLVPASFPARRRHRRLPSSSCGRVKNSLNCGRCIINKPEKLLLPATWEHFVDDVLFGLGWRCDGACPETANAIETCDGNFNSRLAFISIYRLRSTIPCCMFLLFLLLL